MRRLICGLVWALALLVGVGACKPASESVVTEVTSSEEVKSSEEVMSSEEVTSTESVTASERESETSESSEGTSEISVIEEEANPYARVIPQPTIWSKSYDDPNYNITGIESIRMVGLITGDGSPNRTRERFRVGGTDLGIPVLHNERMYYWFGDTLLGDDQGRPMEGGMWRSNVLAVSDDMEFGDGLTIDHMIGLKAGDVTLATERVNSKKVPGVEHTVIPTGSVSVNGKLYVYFMSIREWGTPGGWDLNYGGLAVSEDDGETFTKLDAIKLDPERFGQVAAYVEGDYVYAVTIGGGRFGDAYLMRVPTAEIESMEAYEYLSDVVDDAPVWSKDPEAAKVVVEKQVGEASLTYNPYLEEYMLTYLDEARAEVVLRTATELWGPWSYKLTIASSKDYPGLYCGFVHEKMMANDGKTFYFIMSQWDPIYNSILFEVNLTERRASAAE